MRVLQRSHWWVSLAIAALISGGVARAGANTWTPMGAAFLVTADPHNPDVVYAVFNGSDLNRSMDGGRTWTRLATFQYVYSLLVHPASPNTLYAGASDSTGYNNVFKSSDGGVTWTRTPASVYQQSFGVLVGSPTDPNVVYAASGEQLYQTTDGGVTWGGRAALTAAISDLVIHPQNPSILYASGDSGYYYPFGAFATSTDKGGSWAYPPHLGFLDQVRFALDPTNPSRLYLGLASGRFDTANGVRRSDDGGQTWSEVDSGLPARAQVGAITLDPANTATVYAGTNHGIYRSRDSGSTWLPFSQVLRGAPFLSLVPSSDGKRLLAVTGDGAFEFSYTEGPIDVAATAAGGGSGVLSWSAERLAVQTMSGSGSWSASSFEGPVAAWQAVAVASSGDGRSHVLWQAGDGRWAIEVVGPGGRESALVFDAAIGWIPADISVGTDGTTHLLFAGDSGAMYVASLDSGGTVHSGAVYGPTPNWSAIALADAPDGGAWVLWRNNDGRSAFSVHRGGAMESFARFDASADGAVVDIAVGADGKARVLVADSVGNARIWTVASDGSRTSGDPLAMTGLSPQRVSAAPDGGFRLLWTGNGHGTVAVLDAGGAVVSVHDVPALQ